MTQDTRTAAAPQALPIFQAGGGWLITSRGLARPRDGVAFDVAEILTLIRSGLALRILKHGASADAAAGAIFGCLGLHAKRLSREDTAKVLQALNWARQDRARQRAGEEQLLREIESVR